MAFVYLNTFIHLNSKILNLSLFLKDYIAMITWKKMVGGENRKERREGKKGREKESLHIQNCIADNNNLKMKSK